MRARGRPVAGAPAQPTGPGAGGPSGQQRLQARQAGHATTTASVWQGAWRGSCRAGYRPAAGAAAAPTGTCSSKWPLAAGARASSRGTAAHTAPLSHRHIPGGGRGAGGCGHCVYPCACACSGAHLLQPQSAAGAAQPCAVPAPSEPPGGRSGALCLLF